MGMHQGCRLSPFLFALVVGVFMKFASDYNELLYAGDVVLMS